MIFNRKAMLAGHRFYSSARSISEWGTGGPRANGHEAYDSRGWLVPPKPEHIAWEDYAPRRIRPFRAAPRAPAADWGGSRMSPHQRGVPWRRENDGPTDEWLSERNAAGTATKHGQAGTRIERVLVEERSPLIVALRQVKELLRPAEMAANDNTPPSDTDGNSGMGAERVHNQSAFAPSVPEIMAAVSSVFRSHVVTKKRRDGGNGRQRDIVRRHAACGFSFIEGNVLLGTTDWRRKLVGLLFRNGELIAYGDYKGRKCRPAYIADHLGLVIDEESETAKHIAAQPAENLSYAKLKSVCAYVSGQSPNAPRPLAPPPRTARAAANDNVLAAARTNTKVMPAVQKLPDGVAYGYGRLAGIADLTGTGDGKTSAPYHDVLSELDREEKLAAAKIDTSDLEVLDAIMDDESFRSIGLRFGYAESSAHRMGRRVIEKTLQRISEKIAA